MITLDRKIGGGATLHRESIFTQHVLDNKLFYSVQTKLTYVFKMPKYLIRAKQIDNAKTYRTKLITNAMHSLMSYWSNRQITVDLNKNVTKHNISKFEFNFELGVIKVTYWVSGEIPTAEQEKRLFYKIREIINDFKEGIKQCCVEYKAETGIPWRGIHGTVKNEKVSKDTVDALY